MLMKQLIKKLAIIALSGFTAVALASEKSFVWKVSHSESGDGRIMYLGGTVHVLGADDYPLPAVFDKAYASSEELIFEMDLGEQQTANFQQAMMKKMFYPAGTTLASEVDQKTLNELKKYCDLNRFPLAQFLQMKPGMVSITISMNELMKLGMNQQGVDSFYYAKAKQDGKSIIGLETIAEQIDFLATMGSENPSKLILQTLDEASEIETLFPIIKQAWRKGDAKQLDQLMVESMQKDYPGVYKSLLVERNNNWMPKLEQELKDKDVEFVLVGAAHLVGKDGLLTQLKNKGYTVETY